MLLFAGCQCAVLFRGRTNREARLLFLLFFFFFFLYIFFIFLFPDSFEDCRFFYHRDQFHCSKPARSDQARLTHETHWSVSGENSHRGGWWHLRRGFPHDRGGKKRPEETFFFFFASLENFSGCFWAEVAAVFPQWKEDKHMRPEAVVTPSLACWKPVIQHGGGGGGHSAFSCITLQILTRQY